MTFFSLSPLKPGATCLRLGFIKEPFNDVIANLHFWGFFAAFAAVAAAVEA